MTEKFSLHWATIVLAAGSSSRMGQSKQLISIAGETLLQKTLNAAVQVGCPKILVVTGANREVIQSTLKSTVAEFVHNPEWENGMGSSLKCGLNFVMSHFPQAEAVLFLVCDQPLLNAEHLKKIVEEFKITKSPIVASFYSGKNGVPVLFHKSLFHRLLAIDDHHGAKKIIAQYPTLVKSIDFPNGAVDLDTPEDLQKFKNRKEGI